MAPWQQLHFLLGWAARVPSTFYFVCSFAMSASFTKTNDRKGELSPVCPFWICEQRVKKLIYLFTVLLFWISLEEFLRTKKTKIISTGFAQSLSEYLTRSRTLGQEWAPLRLAVRKEGKLIGKDALTLAPVCSVPGASPLLEETLKNLPIISTLWAESQKEQTRPWLSEFSDTWTASDSIILLSFDLKRP